MKYSSESLRLLLPDIGLEQKDISDELPRNEYNNNQERILRVLSWLTAAQKSKVADARLMYTWVAFNALYARPYKKEISATEERSKTEKGNIRRIIKNLLDCDRQRILSKYLVQNKDRCEEILRNEYLYDEYWDGENKWRKNYRKSNKDTKNSLESKYPKEPLIEIMFRIQALRNQLMHGGAGYNDYYNRWQVKACDEFLFPLVGRMLSIVIQNNDTSWGKVPYPPQNADPKTFVGERVDKATFLESESGQDEKRK